MSRPRLGGSEQHQWNEALAVRGSERTFFTSCWREETNSHVPFIFKPKTLLTPNWGVRRHYYLSIMRMNSKLNFFTR